MNKYTRWVYFLVLAALLSFQVHSQTPAAPPRANTLSPAAGEVVKLSESGTSDEVILGYIQNSQTPYNLTADDVIYLKDVGVSSQVVTAMLNHDKAAPQPPYTYNQQLYPPSGQTPPPPAPEPQPAPDQPPAAPPTGAQPAPPPAYVSSTAPPEVNYFYNDLTPYGSWVNLDGYGWCWQPSVVAVNPGWRPYCDSGHWVYTDAGWFWASDYSWGWAPFHYGRWHLHPRCGWVWFPDTVWSPAWVVWRSYGTGCGWAPLPYGAVFDAGVGFRFNGVRVSAGFDFGLGVGLFTFVGFHDLTARNVAHYRLAPAEAGRIFHQTTVINSYSADKNHMVINRGVPVDRISEATHSQIHTVSIHNLPAGSARPTTRGGPDAVVFRHELGATPPHTGPVVAQKVDNSHPVIQHSSGTGHGLTGSPTSAYPPPRTGAQPQYTAPQPHNQSTYSTTQHQPTGKTPPSSYGNQPKQTVTTGQPPTTSHNYNYSTSGSTAPKQTTTTQTPTPLQQNSHVYYPRGYYQSSSIHMLPSEPGTSGASHTSSSSSPPSTGQSGSSSHGQSQGQPKRQQH